MNAIKAVARSVSFSSHSSNSNRSRRFEREKLDPIVGFQLTLQDSAADITSGPQLDVHLIGARHLPSNFGLKSVEGYQVKVKLFPGSMKFDSSIQTSSWPSFNETFRFPMSPSHKSSMKSKNRDYKHDNANGSASSLPERVFQGTFVVFTVVALLELPNGANSAIKETVKETYKTFKRQGSLIIRNSTPKILTTLNMVPSVSDNKKEEKEKPKTQRLTTSESQRNIGSVTFFLDAKSFEENPRTKIFQTNELWLPIRDLTVAPNSRLSVQSSPKGQVEIILELCDNSTRDESAYDRSLNPFECQDDYFDETASTTSKSRFSLSDMKLPNVKRFMRRQREKQSNSAGLVLKITTSKMRCSIKVKEEFENDTSQIYIKTTVLEREILSGSWKSDTFAPTLSTRWDHLDSTIAIQLPNDGALEYVSIKCQLATKTKMGKKIVLGTVYVRPETEHSSDHWSTMSISQNNPIPCWYSFE